MKKTLKKKWNKGITLIALVITIIVLLILVGVTIASITGENGILEKAQSAEIKNEKASIQEEIERAVLASRMNDDIKIDTTMLEEELNKIDDLTIESKGTDGNLPWTVVAKEYKIQITENGQVKEDTSAQDNLPIGEYVEYNVSYTDMYVSDIDTETEGNQGFTSTNGWRILDPGIKNADGSYRGAKIISTGIPATIYYYYNKAYDGSDINENNKPAWWGTKEQVAEVYDSTHADAGYIYGKNNGCPNYYAATGLFKNFTSISFEQTNNPKYNKGGYTSITNNGNAANGEITGEVFKTEKASEVHNLTLAELNKAINEISGSSRSEDDTDAVPQSVNLFYLKGLSNFNYSSSVPYYWLAFPYSKDTGNLKSVDNWGGVSNYGTHTYGCRPIISLNSDIYKDGDIWKIK